MGEQSKNTIHLVKLCVGVQSLTHLEGWRAQRARQTGETLTRHVTRMWPKQEAALLNGGSLYWVIKGVIQARQKVLRLDEEIGQDGIRRCAIVMDPELIRVAPTRKRAFQGWRYLKPGDAPVDLPSGRAEEAPLPADMSAALAEIGVL